eukprot:GHVR01142849.1.p1 GENE.GHVR01142849.1~~GHVR01142849.1.p1  ORF type:complete len:335 (+),score=72.27 GHVR01142849.1:275-1279(+)
MAHIGCCRACVPEQYLEYYCEATFWIHEFSVGEFSTWEEQSQDTSDGQGQETVNTSVQSVKNTQLRSTQYWFSPVTFDQEKAISFQDACVTVTVYGRPTDTPNDEEPRKYGTATLGVSQLLLFTKELGTELRSEDYHSEEIVNALKEEGGEGFSLKIGVRTNAPLLCTPLLKGLNPVCVCVSALKDLPCEPHIANCLPVYTAVSIFNRIDPILTPPKKVTPGHDLYINHPVISFWGPLLCSDQHILREWLLLSSVCVDVHDREIPPPPVCNKEEIIEEIDKQNDKNKVPIPKAKSKPPEKKQPPPKETEETAPPAPEPIQTLPVIQLVRFVHRI